MKSYTDLEQSKKLAEILPLESADMYYMETSCNNYTIGVLQRLERNMLLNQAEYYRMLPCWSLTALISILQIYTIPTAFSVKVSTPSLIKTENGYKLTYTGDYTPMINNGLNIEAPIESVSDNAIDCCVNIIIKLNELNLL
jgi:hypothetical protein